MMQKLKGTAGLKGREPQFRAAFTLLELMGVIVLIVVLAALFSASLNSAKHRVHQITCLNNLKQLQTGWMMYVDENEDILPLNHSVPSPNLRLFGRRNTTNSWVAGNPKEDTSDAPLRQGTLFPYLRSVEVFHCPTDNSRVPGKDIQRTRSYSMNGYLYGDNAGIDPRVKTNFWQLVRPPPEKVFVFIEEHEASVWGGSFVVKPQQGLSLASTSWTSTPSDRHNQGCNLSFADGHIEFWKWSNPKQPVSPHKFQLSRQDVQDLRRLQSSVPTP